VKSQKNRLERQSICFFYAACAVLASAEVACGDDDDQRALLGTRLDLDRNCFEAEPVEVGFDDGRPCGDEVTTTKAPNGECWAFPNTCIPEGWKEVSDGSCPMFEEPCPEN
jgi:hypothetical protein